MTTTAVADFATEIDPVSTLHFSPTECRPNSPSKSTRLHFCERLRLKGYAGSMSALGCGADVMLASGQVREGPFAEM